MNAAESLRRTFSRRSLHGQVAHEIGARIIRGELAPGETLPNEAELSAELSVSRTALREAIKLLAAKGLVESRPKTGTRIRQRAAWNMLDPDVLSWLVTDGRFDLYADHLFEMRRIVEPAAAAIAAQRGDAEAVARVRAAYEAMEAAGDDVEASIAPDLRFHQAILEATRNQFLAPLGALIETALATSFRISGSDPGTRPIALPRHKAVLDAIERRDPEGARRAAEKLLDAAAMLFHRVVDDDEASGTGT